MRREVGKVSKEGERMVAIRKIRCGFSDIRGKVIDVPQPTPTLDSCPGLRAQPVVITVLRHR
jgi:hypothetical protein